MRVACLIFLCFLCVAAEAQVTEGSAETVEEDVVARKQPETILEFAVAGGLLMVPITICSVVWLAFLVERLMVLRQNKVIPPQLVDGIRGMLKGDPVEPERARSLVEEHPSAAATVLRVAVDHIDQDRTEIERSVNNTAQREIFLLRKNMRIFSVIANVAPLLGLLGTVTGLVQSFREVAVSGLGSGAALAPGIYKALITTVGGLVIAIPALLTYYWLMARVDRYVHELDNLVVDYVDARLGKS